jgi:hypothetical protein
MWSRIEHTATHYVLDQVPEDDLAAIAGVINGLAITVVFYSIVAVAWWLW